MSLYIIKANPTNECEEKDKPDAKLTEGMECDGFLLLGFKNDKISFESIMNVSVDNLQKFLIKDSNSASVIIQAAYIADGYAKAIKVHKDHFMKSVFRDAFADTPGDDDEED